jgi:MFS family permease
MKSIQSASSAALASGSLTHIVQDGLSATINVLLPVLAQTFGLSYAQVGLLRGSKDLVQSIVEMGSGWLSERLGEYRLLAIGLILSGIGYAMISAAPGLVAVAAGLAMVGIGTALHHAPSSALIASAFASGRRSSALGIYNASGDTGKLVFSGGFSFAAGAGLAWHQTSIAYAGLAVLAAMAIVVISLEVRRKARNSEPENAGSDKEKANGINGSVSRWGVLNWRSFSVLLATICIDNMVQTSVLVFTAFLMLSKGLPLWMATGATVVLLAGGVVGKAVCGFLADKLGVRPAFTLIQCLTALGLAAMVFAPIWLTLVLLVPLGAVVQGSTSITYGFAADLIDPKRMARGYALLYASGSLTSAIGPPLFGAIGDWMDISIAFYTMGFATLLAVPMIYLLPQPSADG